MGYMEQRAALLIFPPPHCLPQRLFFFSVQQKFRNLSSIKFHQKDLKVFTVLMIKASYLMKND